MRKIVVVTLLVVFLMAPVAAMCEPIQCDRALQSHKLLDWVVCAIVAIAMGDGYEIPGGYLMWYT